MLRVYSACSASAGKLATIHGTYRYPGPTVVQACGTHSKPTSQPALVVVFYRHAFAGGSSGPFSCLMVPPRGMTTVVKPCWRLAEGLAKQCSWYHTPTNLITRCGG